ncbi:uncharacterized protein CCR75_001184 [Bremia lactucae]|uniref:Uncharacterized protein n=1 Tax=Bremia lactucae TaxID=4779 RepID=A0A976IM62_BRELC|nr:hypothetical protein CCR75_001184 [Bremia lactucae]
MKLAKAAAQQLKGVIIEYDVLCSSLLGKSEIEMRCNVAAEKKHQEIKEHLSPSLFDPKSIKSMLVSDVRRLLKDLNEDSTGKPWAAKERLQNTLQGLPNQILNRITGFDEQGKDASVENNTNFASLAPARMKQQNHEVEKLNMGLQLKRGEQGSSLRDKYMDKLNQLKEKKQQESVARHEEAENGTTSEGLSTWLVNDGANEVLSYSDLRGFFKAIIPPRNPLQNDEYLQFQKEASAQIIAIQVDFNY